MLAKFCSDKEITFELFLSFWCILCYDCLTLRCASSHSGGAHENHFDRGEESTHITTVDYVLSLIENCFLLNDDRMQVEIK